MATDPSGNASSFTPQPRNTARDLSSAEVDHAQHIVDSLTLAAANVKKEALRRRQSISKLTLATWNWNWLRSRRQPPPSQLTTWTPLYYPCWNTSSEYRMANVEAIRVAEEASSANLVLKAKVRKLDRLHPQVTSDLTLNTPHEQLQFEIPPASKASHIRARSCATIQRLLSTYIRHRRKRQAGCPPVDTETTHSEDQGPATE